MSDYLSENGEPFEGRTPSDWKPKQGLSGREVRNLRRSAQRKLDKRQKLHEHLANKATPPRTPGTKRKPRQRNIEFYSQADEMGNARKDS